MSHLVTSLLLLGQHNRLDSMSRTFRNRTAEVDAGYLLTGLAVLAAIVLGMWILSQLLAHQERRGARNNGPLLFLALCKAHGLSWSQKWLLWRLARHHRLRDPARLFIEPSRFAAENLGPGLRLKQGEFARLKEQLFRLPPPVESSEETPTDGGSRGTAGAVEFPAVDSPSLDVPPWGPGAGAGTS